MVLQKIKHCLHTTHSKQHSSFVLQNNKVVYFFFRLLPAITRPIGFTSRSEAIGLVQINN